jgi:hypothetical protein
MVRLSSFEWLVLAAALLLCPGFAWTAEPEAGAGATAPAVSLFDRLDRNKDGYLSREELAADEAKNRNWIALDRDRDGRISRSEFRLISIPSATSEPAAAAGGSGSGASAARAPKQE